MQELSPEQQNKLKRLKSVLDGGGEMKDALMMDLMAEAIRESLSDIEVKATVDMPKFPEIPEQKAPIVNIPAPIVNVTSPEITVKAPIVNVDTEEISEGVKQILKQLKEQIPFTIDEYVKDGRIKVEVDRVGTGGGGVISFPIVDALANRKRNEIQLAVQVDDVSTTSVTYIGKSIIGAATSSALWQVQKIDESSSPITATVKWAGKGQFNQIWDNRTSLTYT